MLVDSRKNYLFESRPIGMENVAPKKQTFLLSIYILSININAILTERFRVRNNFLISLLNKSSVFLDKKFNK